MFTLTVSAYNNLDHSLRNSQSELSPCLDSVLCTLFIHKLGTIFIPFPPSVPIWQRLAKLSILILEGTIKKISYERCDYESVDEKSLS